MKQKIIIETSTVSETLICNHQKSQKTVKQFHFPHQQKTLKTVISSGKYTNQSDEKYVSRASTTTPLTTLDSFSRKGCVSVRVDEFNKMISTVEFLIAGMVRESIRENHRKNKHE